jgi:hypothetical protein
MSNDLDYLEGFNEAWIVDTYVQNENYRLNKWESEALVIDITDLKCMSCLNCTRGMGTGCSFIWVKRPQMLETPPAERGADWWSSFLEYQSVMPRECGKYERKPRCIEETIDWEILMNGKELWLGVWGCDEYSLKKLSETKFLCTHKFPPDRLEYKLHEGKWMPYLEEIYEPSTKSPTFKIISLKEARGMLLRKWHIKESTQ